jgi:ATP-dependent RNA helicase SUPV3L1/SUV3
MLQWRNSELDFSSLGALQAALSMTPTEAGLTRAPVAEDILVLEHAARDEEIRALASNRETVERLWDVCQVPDYRKIAPAMHAELAVTLYGFLMREGKIPVDWFSSQVAQADRTDGDIDTLSNRIAHVRTWTFVANRPDWLADPEHWQAETRSVEDKLSDALHERLTERFVDRRTSVLMKRLRENTTLETEIQKGGEVVVEGHVIGRLDGFTFAAENSTGGSDAKALQAAARSALAGEIDARATKVAQAPEREFVLASDGTLRWSGAAVAKLAPGDDVMRPRLRLIADEHLSGAPREAVQARLDLWLKTQIERMFAPLFALAAAEDVTGISRGIAYQLIEATGVLERQRVAEEVKGLDQPSRATLRKYGIRFGAYHIYMPGLLKPAPRSLAAQLWALKHEQPDVKGLDELQRLAASGRTSIPVDKETPKALYRTIGYRVCGERAIRVDILERLADLIRPALSWRQSASGAKPPGAFDGTGFTVTGAMTSLTGASGEDFASILRSLGYRMERRPKPPEVEKPKEADQPTIETPASVETPAEAAMDAAAASTDEASPALTPEAEPVAEPTVSEAIPAEPAPTAAILPEVSFAPTEAPEEVSGTEEQAPKQAELQAGEAGTTPSSVESETPAVAAEPELIEIWRTGRPSGTRNRREANKRRRRPDQTAAQPQAAPADGQAVAASAEAPATTGDATPAPGGERKRDGRPRHRRDREGRQDGDQPRPPQSGERKERQDFKRPGGDRPDRPPRGDRSDRPPRRDRDRDRDSNRPGRTWSSDNDRRGKEADPNSPFAKLLALKEQLEANKER